MTNSVEPEKLKTANYLQTPVEGANCPVCGTRTGKLLYSVSSKQSAQHFVLEEVDPQRHQALVKHIQTLWGQDTCDLICCDSCGFVFASPYVGGDATFYNLAYQRSGYPKWKWEYQIAADLVAETSNIKGKQSLRLLEIGAGDGAFVRKIASDSVEKNNILCLEFSEYGRNRILAAGIECLGEDVRAIKLFSDQDKFDVICMFQVLEHMDNLDVLFEKLTALSKPQAQLIIAVPNGSCIVFNETNGCLLDMPPNHIGRWTQDAFKQISAKYGWSIKQHQVEPQNFKETLKQQVSYYYLRQAQTSATVANKIERIENEKTRKILRILASAIYAIGRIDILAKAAYEPSLGNTELVHLVKNS